MADAMTRLDLRDDQVIEKRRDTGNSQGLRSGW